VSITVTPAQFENVFFDAAVIQMVAEEMADAAGVAGMDISIEVDETSLLGAFHVRELTRDRLDVVIESGAFENLRKPRHLSEDAARDVLGRMFLMVRDRLDPEFAYTGPRPTDGTLPVPHFAAWDTYTCGRLERRGYDMRKPRRLYLWRNRHGFSDASDAYFDALWHAEKLTWSEIVERSEAARALRGAPLKLE
jgi:hypothetical protein